VAFPGDPASDLCRPCRQKEGLCASIRWLSILAHVAAVVALIVALAVVFSLR
jgi:hypothetical protein